VIALGIEPLGSLNFEALKCSVRLAYNRDSDWDILELSS
jgi:hypothetical protein